MTIVLIDRPDTYHVDEEAVFSLDPLVKGPHLTVGIDSAEKLARRWIFNSHL